MIDAQCPRNPLMGAENVDEHRSVATVHILEQEGRSAFSNNAAGNLGDFQFAADRRFDSAQLAFAVQESDELAQILVVAHVLTAPCACLICVDDMSLRNADSGMG